MISLVLIVLLVSLASIDCQAQQQWTLRQCMDYAIEHNISIKQQDNVRRQQELSLSTSRNSRLPDLSASASENYSFGRAQTLDGTYSNRNTNSTSFSIGTSVPLFTGFEIPNRIKLNQLNLEAATQDLEKAKNDIRMQVAQAYVQILYNMEIADVACRQVAIDSAQVKRLEAFVENGKASQAQLSQQQATLAQAQLTATQADNNLQLSVLALTQLLELPSPEGFSIVRPDNTSLLVLHSSLPSPDAIYQEALTIKPEVRAEQLRLSAADKSISIAKAALYPKLYFNAGLQTNYYKTNGMKAESFASQMKNNFAQYLGVSLSIPIFNRFATRNNVRSARIDRENRQLQFDLVRKTLYKDIQQVYYNAVAAGSKYESSKQAQQSSQDAFKLTQAKYENGKASITEFNEAKNNYLKTESDLVQARYEYLYQTALLDFYRGRDLNF
ncbi:outer membrane protein [Prevotellaceae bacterium HUN156]|nr:outer membrane protein [Prevotellaceae bacterium HUN156]